MSPRHPNPAPTVPAQGRDRHAGSRGQALVELALVVPILLLVLVGAGDLARVFAARITIESAARAGALEAAIHPASFVENQPCDAASNRVMCAVTTESRGGAIAVTPADVAVDCYNDHDWYRHHHHEGLCTEGLGHMIQVTVVGHVQLLTPLLTPFTGGQAFDITAVASAQVAVRPNISGEAVTPGPTPGFTPLPLPTPTPEPTPTLDPSATPGPTPTPAPTPSPTPYCAPPVADFSVSPTIGRKQTNGRDGTLFSFTDDSTTTPLCPLTWSWNFGDGGGATSVSNLENPQHAYESQSGQGNNPGAFHVVLIASNAGGSSSFEVLVTVTP